jgi:protease-4
MAKDNRYQEQFLDDRDGKSSSGLFKKKATYNHRKNSSEPWSNASSTTPQITMLKDPKNSQAQSIKEVISSIFKTIDFIFKSIALSLTFIGFIVVLIGCVVIASFSPSGSFGNKYPYQLPEQMFIKLDLDNISTETYGGNLLDELSNLNSQELLLHDAVKILSTAAKDDRVEGIYAKLNNTSLGIAQIQELRNAIENFGNAGKETILFSENMGAFGTGTAEYYLASAFKNINMIPTGEVGLTGLKAEIPFIRTPLDKLGIHPSFSSRYEYKTGATTFTDKDFSDVNKEGTEKLIESLYEQITSDIARTRGKKIDEIKGLINNGPYSAKEAFANGLIDNVTYLSDLSNLMEETHPETSLIQYNEYLEEIQPAENPLEVVLEETINNNSQATPEIAVINAFGTILPGESKKHKIASSAKLGSDSFRRLLYSMENDDNIKAVVIRVDSPGGGYVPSDIIRQQIETLKVGKPVIISMGNVAASGGYFISIAGDKIVAEPTTITGSIGVYGGKMVVEEMWKKLGITWGSVSKGKNAGMASMNSDFTPSQREKFEKSLDNVYKDFTQKVATARNIPIKDMDKIARGRVWTGKQAIEIGLVDELGGLEKAIELAKTAITDLNLAPADNIKTVRYPKPKTPEEMLLEFISTGKLPNSVSINNANPMNILQKYSQSIENPEFINLSESVFQIKYWIESMANQSAGLIMKPLLIK